MYVGLYEYMRVTICGSHSSFRCKQHEETHFRPISTSSPRRPGSDVAAELKSDVCHLLLVVFIKLETLGLGEVVLPVTDFPCKYSGVLAQSGGLLSHTFIHSSYLFS